VGFSHINFAIDESGDELRLSSAERSSPVSGNTIEPRRMTKGSLGTAKASLAFAVAFLILLAALHFIKPVLNPFWNMISEYEVGHDGWIMQLAFLCLALSCLGFVAPSIPRSARLAAG
jgi:hypothetical protein